MPIPFACPHCGHATDVDDQYAGQTGPCSACGKTVTVPGAAGLTPPPAGPSNSGKTVLLIVLAVVLMLAIPCGGILVAILLPAVATVRNNARQVQCMRQWDMIHSALTAYEMENGALPPAYLADDEGRPKHSWRVLLLPYLGEQTLYDQYDFDEPWDSPGNLEVAKQMPQVYACPAAEPTPPDEPGKTHYVLLVGKGTLFQGAEPPPFDVFEQYDTLLAVESPRPVVWTQPEDLDIERLRILVDPALKCNHGDSFTAMGYEGGTEPISRDIDFRLLRERAKIFEAPVEEHPGFF